MARFFVLVDMTTFVCYSAYFGLLLALQCKIFYWITIDRIILTDPSCLMHGLRSRKCCCCLCSQTRNNRRRVWVQRVYIDSSVFLSKLAVGVLCGLLSRRPHYALLPVCPSVFPSVCLSRSISCMAGVNSCKRPTHVSGAITSVQTFNIRNSAHSDILATSTRDGLYATPTTYRRRRIRGNDTIFTRDCDVSDCDCYAIRGHKNWQFITNLVNSSDLDIFFNQKGNINIQNTSSSNVH